MENKVGAMKHPCLIPVQLANGSVSRHASWTWWAPMLGASKLGPAQYTAARDLTWRLLTEELWECISQASGACQTGTRETEIARSRDRRGEPGKGCRSCLPAGANLGSCRRLAGEAIERLQHTLKACSGCMGWRGGAPSCFWFC